MVSINIGNGQGMTQAIASNLGLQKDDCKKVSLSTWQQVMSLVDQSNTQQTQGNKPSIFSGSHDANAIGNKSSDKTNFLVHTGQKVEIDESIWGKIKALLTGKPQVPKTSAQGIGNTPLAAPAIPALSTTATTATSTVQKTGDVQGSTAELVAQKNPVMVANTSAEGDLKTGEAVYKMLDKMNKLGDLDAEITVTSDEWRALANKKDKTPEETLKMKEELQENMKKTGNSLTMYIDKKFGNGSGKIDKAAFMKYQADGVPAADVKNPQFAIDAENAFNRLDLDKDGTIGKEEMSAFVFAMDFGKNGGANGIISQENYIDNGQQLSEPEPNMLDKKLAYTYGALYGKKPDEQSVE